MNDDLQKRMESCSIINDYDGLDSLIEFSEQNPIDASNIAWAILTSRADPGKDDHALCDELIKLMGKSLQLPELEDRVTDFWRQAMPEIRMNLLSGVTTGVFSKQFVKSLFYAPGSGTVERHRIVAGLASCRLDECRELLSELVEDIGEHDEPARQKILTSFLANLRNALKTTTN